MKKFKLFSTLFALLCTLSLPLISSCDDTDSSSEENTHVDYAEQLKIDLNDNSKARLNVTVYNYVDGDTTHFNTNSKSIPDDGTGILKARYNAIDTPESTGKVEEWGKSASLFTRGKLETAESIIIESEETTFTKDSTGERYVVWVWYRTSATADYRLLNLEIVQEGYSMVKNAEATEYGKVISKAYTQAMNEKLHLFGEHNDPNYYYGDAQTVTIKEIRENINDYLGVKVNVNGYVTRMVGSYVYIQDYDGETDLWYGFTVYLGFTQYSIIKENQYMKFVGNVMYYETGDIYQISGLTYMRTRPDYKDNIKLLDNSECEGDLTKLPLETTYTEIKTRGEDILSALVKLTDLEVTSTYTTNNGGDSDGALTLTVRDSDGKTFKVRTTVLYDDSSNLVTEDYFEQKTIDVVGIVDKYDGEIQVKLCRLSDVEIK